MHLYETIDQFEEVPHPRHMQKRTINSSSQYAGFYAQFIALDLYR